MNPNPSGPASIRIDQEGMSLILLQSVRDTAHLASPGSAIMLRLIVAFIKPSVGIIALDDT